MSPDKDLEALANEKMLVETMAHRSADEDLHRQRYSPPASTYNGSQSALSEKLPQILEGDYEEPASAAGPANHEDEIMRTETTQSNASRKNRVSRAISAVSRVSKKSKKELPPPVLPVSDLSNGIIGWEHQDDPHMPLNFSLRRKYLIVCSLSLITLMTPLSSSILAPAISYLQRDFNVETLTIASMPVSIYLLGYAVGPLFLSPLSEIYGRAIVLSSSNIFFCVWHIGCALAPNLGSLIAFRLLAGIGGSACMTLGGGVIADVFPVEQRGFAMSIWTIGPLIGPSLGPIVGAFVAGSIGWRWGAWIVFIPSVIITVSLAILLPETNHKVLIQRKVRALRKQLNRPELESCYETAASRSLSQSTILVHGLVRPLRILFLAPIVTVLSLYVAFLYGTIYLMYNTIPMVYEKQYGWSTGLTGLVFLALAAGYAVGLAMFSILSDRTVVRLTKANDGVYEPEMRLPSVVYYAIITPLSFFWYGWTAEKQVHWVVPMLGLFPLGLGIFGIWMSFQAYIIDACSIYASSGLAAFAVLRSIVAAFLPLVGPSMFDEKNLGLGWGNSLLGFICVALIPVPVLVHRFGGRIRKKYPLKM